MTLVPRTLAIGVGHCEGPVIRPDGELVFVSMDQGRLYTFKDGRTNLFADVGHYPNGATEGSDGKIYVAQVGDPRWASPNPGVGGIQVVDRDGTVSWLTKDLITPNDLCFGPDGLLYVTDPTRFRPARDDGRLFRCNIETGEAELLCSMPWFPNGIAFDAEDALYVADTGQRRIVRYAMDGGRLGKEETCVQMPPSHRPDGFLFDVAGNIVIGANSNGEDPAYVMTYDRNGKLIDTFIPSPNKSGTNVALGPDRVLIVTAVDMMIAVDGWPHAGLPLHPFR